MQASNLPLPSPVVSTGGVGFAVGLAAALVALGFVADIVPHVLFSVVALLAFMVYVANVARNAPHTFALLAVYLFLRVTMFVSGIAIGTGAYMPEVVQYGAPSGAFLRLCAIYILIIGIIRVMLEPRAPRLKANAEAIAARLPWSDTQHHIWVLGLFGAVSLMLLYLMFFGLQNGFALLQGTSRMAYRMQFAEGSFLNTILNNRGIIVGLLGLVFAFTTGFRRKVSLALLAVFGLLNILFGEKFTSLVTLLVDFFVPTMILQASTYPWRRVKNLLPLTGLVALVVAITFPVMLMVYSGDEGTEAGLTRFYERVTSQAQLWYLVDADTPDLIRFDTAALAEDGRMLFSDDPKGDMAYPYSGLYNVMAEYAPTDLFSASMDLQLGYTMAFEAYMVKILGWVGFLLPVILIAIMQGCLLMYWLWAINTRDPISLFLALKLQVWAKGTFNDGDLYFLLGYKMWIFIALVIAYEFVSKSMYKKPR